MDWGGDEGGGLPGEEGPEEDFLPHGGRPRPVPAEQTLRGAVGGWPAGSRRRRRRGAVGTRIGASEAGGGSGPQGRHHAAEDLLALPGAAEVLPEARDDPLLPERQSGRTGLRISAEKATDILGG